jgi:hypothetical protein
MHMIDCQWEEYTEVVKVCGPDGCRTVEQQRLRCTNPGCSHKLPPVHKDTGLVKWPLNDKRPPCNCKYRPDVIEAAKALGVFYERLPGQIVDFIGQWQAAGRPRREEAEIDRLWHAQCESRGPGGMCGAIGCGNDVKGKFMACLWMATMATAACPKGHFKSIYQKADEANGQAIQAK